MMFFDVLTENVFTFKKIEGRICCINSCNNKKIRAFQHQEITNFMYENTEKKLLHLMWNFRKKRSDEKQTGIHCFPN